MSNLIEQSVVFNVPAHEVYEALMDSARHAAFSHSPAQISREEGGEFMVYDGYISGVNIELAPDSRIVQRWRAVDWPDDRFSLVTFALREEGGHTRLDFRQDGVPEGSEDEFRQGWIDNYWEPMKAFLEG